MVLVFLKLKNKEKSNRYYILFIVFVIYSVEKDALLLANRIALLKQEEINEHLYNSIFGYLTLIGDFLKGC
jgi:hypothetical protein